MRKKQKPPRIPTAMDGVTFQMSDRQFEKFMEDNQDHNDILRRRDALNYCRGLESVTSSTELVRQAAIIDQYIKEGQVFNPDSAKKFIEQKVRNSNV